MPIVPRRDLVLLVLSCLFILSFSCLAHSSDIGTAKSRIDALASYVLPEGWQLEEGTDINDPALYMSKDLHTITIRLLGGKDSDWATPEDYLKLPGTTMGHPPKKIGKIKVSGIETWLYEIGFPIDLGDPHESRPGPVHLGTEQYCIVPAGKKYFVLSHSHESQIPDLDTIAEDAWKSFLKEFKLRK